MLDITKKLVLRTANSFGYNVTKDNPVDPVIDHDDVFLSIYSQCQPYTMTSREKMYALYQATQYIIDANIPGDFVECGVWKGGNAMLIAFTLQHLATTNRNIYLYDTYTGMSKPTDNDYRVSNTAIQAINKWKNKQQENHNQWCYAPLEDVKQNMTLTNYPKERLIYVKGKVEDTIPQHSPKEVSLLRLDTDWYQSTKHELEHLYPRLSTSGVLIIDDYGRWAGSKKAVDDYTKNHPILLNRIDNTGRIGVKTSASPIHQPEELSEPSL